VGRANGLGHSVKLIDVKGNKIPAFLLNKRADEAFWRGFSFPEVTQWPSVKIEGVTHGKPPKR